MNDQHEIFLRRILDGAHPRSAARYAGMQPDEGYELLQDDEIAHALKQARLAWLRGPIKITRANVLKMLVVTHELALEAGKYSAANACLTNIMKHVDVDAQASTRLEVKASDTEIAERLRRGRERMNRLTTTVISDSAVEITTVVDIEEGAISEPDALIVEPAVAKTEKPWSFDAYRKNTKEKADEEVNFF